MGLGGARGRYAQVSAAVLNLSGWYDDAYGLEGAATNFNGLVAGEERAERDRARTCARPLGAWHPFADGAAVQAISILGRNALIDYDELVLDFHDHYVRGIANRFAQTPPVRYFVMGANEWRDAQRLAAGDRPRHVAVL